MSIFWTIAVRYNPAMMEPKENRERLISIGADRLADALLYLASRFDEAAEYVDGLLLTPEEAVAWFKRKISSLKRRRKFIDYRAASGFAAELEVLLISLGQAVDDPEAGLELVAEFFRCDRSVFERSDDSDGAIGWVFQHDAADLFARYAASHPDKEHVADVVFELYARDEYGARGSILDKAAKFLPEKDIRSLASRFWEQGKSEPPGSFAAGHWWIGVEILARGIGDPGLFEKARLRFDPNLSPATCMSIAEVYLEADDQEMAMFWMKRIPPSNRFDADRQDRLLYAIHKRLENRKELEETAWRIFRRSPDLETLELLISTLGEEERERVVRDEVARIMEGEVLSYDGLSFLVRLGRLKEAEEHILAHRNEIDGYLYLHIRPLAKELEECGRPLGATLLYRALLESILARAQSKYYHHGVRYLRKLDSLAPMVCNWRGVVPHAEYKQGIVEAHRRKRTFWEKYDSK